MAGVIRLEGRLKRVGHDSFGADGDARQLTDAEFDAAFAAVTDVFPDAVGDPIAKVVIIELDIDADEEEPCPAA